jgi:ribosomal protein S12 methylthiotransferase accessory factor
MSAPIPVVYSEGTHRSVAPEETLHRILPLLPAMGITRVADITGLDRLGISTSCTVRPAARLIQIANGKGLSSISAKVSAIMEAVEDWHAEFPEASFRNASAAELIREGDAIVRASELPRCRTDLHLSDQRMIDWVRGEQLPEGQPVWLPGCSAFLIEPMLLNGDSNGLASGNHIVEATLHALYEVIERDAIARLTRGGLVLPSGQSRFIDLDTLPSGPLTMLHARVRKADVSLRLIRVETWAPVSTFWAVLVDPQSPFACTSVNFGQGSHLSPTVAALRAITEAAQSRLTFIHGSREDLQRDSYEFGETHRRVRAFFEGQSGDLPWTEMADHSSGDLSQDLETVLQGLCSAGFNRIYRVNLTNPRFGIPVVKLLVPGLRSMNF